jgi:ABC-type multidrug transport system ATPase subunit/pSer/pThr/pTyr-binding forkhead associated (FHA) protein
MSRVCPSCGKESKNLKSRFCSDCGQPLPAVDSQEEELLESLPEQGEPKDQAEAIPVDECQDQVEAAEVTRVLPESEPKPESPADGSPEAETPQEKSPEETQEASLAELGLPEHPRLVVREPGEPQWEVTFDQDTFTMGRRSDNDVVLSPNYVSGHHGLFERRDGDWHYVDLGSTNGTFVNGQPMQSAILGDGDILRIGDLQGNSVSLTFRTAEVAAPVPNVISVGATDLGMKPSVIIGRNSQADIPLAAPIVSWEHARLDLTDQGHVLTDLGSTNGTFVNGERLARPCLLKPGDVVQIGPFTLVYEASGFQQYATTGGVRLDGMGLVRDANRGRRKKRILYGIDLSVYPREFVAIVGTSGAGKSTLLMALNGFARANEGQVLANGDDLYDQFDLYRTLVGYVPQDEIIHNDLTVAEALRYAAQLRLPSDTSAEEIERRVNRVLEQVEMVGQKEQVVSSLSGGQRQRVSIAVELLAEPNLFFLDEPTSGLDPGLEKKMMHTLRRLADGGRTILLVTHATANIVQCDHVCFLSQGRMVYFGPPEEALEYFGVQSGDFADIYARLDDPDPETAREKAIASEEAFKQSAQYQKYVADRLGQVSQVRRAASQGKARPRSKVSMVRQFSVLTRRYFDLVRRDKLLMAVLWAVMPIIGSLVLLVSDSNWLVGNERAEIRSLLQAELAETGKSVAIYNVVSDTQILLFIMTLAAVLLGLFAAVYEIVKEWPIYQRERMVSVRVLPYIASKVVVLGGFALIQCALLMLVIGFRVGYPTEGVILPALLEIYITLVLGTLTAILMGLLISAIVPNANAVIYIVFLVLFFQMIFAGVLFNLPGITEHFSNLTLTRWTMEGLGTSVDVERLGSRTMLRLLPGTIVERVEVEVEKRADDWEPVTVVTKTQMVAVPIQPDPVLPVVTYTVPITVPQVVKNEPVTVTETVTKTVTIEPGPMNIQDRQEFRIQYTRSAGHLLRAWGLLVGFGLVFSLAIAGVLRRKDVR